MLMALVTLKDVLSIAVERKTAIPGFNIDNIEIPKAIMEVAEQYGSPVILTIGQGAIQAGQMMHLVDVVRRLADESTVPVVMHLDHGISYEQTIRCLRAGFTSVMFDGSHLPFEQNVAITKRVAEAAHAVGVSVEAELGAINGVEDGIEHSGHNLVDVGEVERFISEVEVDALAVGIGNAHGMYKGLPNLDFELLKKCQALNPPPLVLHGGSGIPDDMIQKAIEIGIRKINVATEIRNAFMSGLEDGVSGRNIYTMYQKADEYVRELAAQKIRLFSRIDTEVEKQRG